MSDVMPEGFEPRTRGRKPLIDPIPVYRRVERGMKENPGQWVMFTTYNSNQVRSLKEQLTRLGCEVSISTATGHKNPALYVRIPQGD